MFAYVPARAGRCAPPARLAVRPLHRQPRLRAEAELTKEEWDALLKPVHERLLRMVADQERFNARLQRLEENMKVIEANEEILAEMRRSQPAVSGTAYSQPFVGDEVPLPARGDEAD